MKVGHIVLRFNFSLSLSLSSYCLFYSLLYRYNQQPSCLPLFPLVLFFVFCTFSFLHTHTLFLPCIPCMKFPLMCVLLYSNTDLALAFTSVTKSLFHAPAEEREPAVCVRCRCGGEGGEDCGRWSFLRRSMAHAAVTEEHLFHHSPHRRVNPARHHTHHAGLRRSRCPHAVAWRRAATG